MPPKKISRPPLTWSQVSAFRLRRHHLVGERRADPALIARDACGLQAQVMSAAELAFRARQPDITRADIHSALWKTRSLVKTSCMRGTLHILAAADFPIYITALRCSRVRSTLQIIARYGVTEREARDVMEAAVETLAPGPLTRRELTERVLALGIARKKAKIWFRQSWWGVMRQALFEGFICYGPDRGREVTLVRTDQWLPKKREIPELEAQQTLLRCYLGAYGPATPRDFSKWSGLSSQEAKGAWSSLERDLAEVEWDARKGFILQNDLDELYDARLDGRAVRLLPNFDTFLLGHWGKDHLVSAKHYKRVYRQAGWISPVVLADGKIIGIWSSKRHGERLAFEIFPFQKFSPAIRLDIEKEVASLGRFFESSWEINYKK